jgi:hypothetical protein
VTLYPFEGATNRTSLIVLEKDEGTLFPVPCMIWHNPRSRGIDTRADLNQVKKLIRQFELSLIPIEITKPESPWMQITEKAYEIIRNKGVIGKSPWYEAHNGVYTALNQVYWIKILEELPNEYLVTNEPIPGQKKAVRQVTARIEKEIVYPLVRGRDVKRYCMIGEYGNIIVPHDPKTGAPLPESRMRINLPKTYHYLGNFEAELRERTIKPFLNDKSKTPFYRLDNIGPYTFAPYKVVWKPIAGAITGKALSFAAAVLEPIDSIITIPDHSLMFVALQNPEEAYYLTAILNSSIVRLIIASYSYEIGVYGHITQYIRIPKFDPNNSLHLKISNLALKAHQLAKKYYYEDDTIAYEELKKVEDEIDKLVAQIYSVTTEELGEVNKSLIILEGGELEEVMEEALESTPNILIENPVLYEGSPQELEITLINPYEESLKNVKVKLELSNKTFEEVLEELLGERRLKISLGRLSLGEYKVKILMEYRLGDSIKRVEKEVPLYVKSSEERLVKRGGLDSILGEEV